MNPYSFAISLRVHHPCLEPAEITRALNREPLRSWKAGEPRMTPTGMPLKGTNKNTYWYTTLIPGGENSSDERPLEMYLDRLTKELQPMAGFFSSLRDQGGGAEFYIGVHSPQTFGFVLAPTLLRTISELGLTLMFEVYEHAQTWR